ncbi:unnamed protein product [Arctia plantaginis]|uniref:Uncharacterized protein n=1 Tax=Arctia plantaginis TaxID=874455 RepID=A0A8S0ZDG8_ARCPL|nr:unnamed protein product [Arctia plantaginis]CAB3249830.1 unnamed protein product [Arctia plantaginis]
MGTHFGRYKTSSTPSPCYWTPSRCAKILIDKDVRDLPADLFIFVKGAGCRWWGAAWWCVAMPPPARVAAPPAVTTTSPFNCRQHFVLLNQPHHPSIIAPLTPPLLLHFNLKPPPPSPAPLVIHIDRASGTLGKGRIDKYPTVAPAAEVVIS